MLCSEFNYGSYRFYVTTILHSLKLKWVGRGYSYLEDVGIERKTIIKLI